MLSNNTKTVTYGRGRARSNIKDIEVPLRRPGENAPCKNNETPYDDIVEIINNLTLNESSLMKSSNEISHLLPDINDKQALKAIIDGLYSRSLEDKAFGTKLARLFSNESFYNIEYCKNESIRYLLLTYLQKNYERREEIRKENEILFRNSVSLLGEINCLRSYTVLNTALVDYLNMLLETASEEDIEVITTQMIINGKNLYKDRWNEKLNEFILNVKKTLVNNTLSPSAKRMLLLIIDLANQEFNSLPKDLYDYYTSHLSTTILMHLQKQQKDVAQDTVTHQTRNKYAAKQMKKLLKLKKPSKANDTLLVDEKQEATVAEENFKSSDSTVTNTDKMNCTEEHVAPRAIRGLGASNGDKSSKTRSNSFTSPLSFSTRNKGWGHDDRFENDYE